MAKNKVILKCIIFVSVFLLFLIPISFGDTTVSGLSCENRSHCATWSSSREDWGRLIETDLLLKSPSAFFIDPFVNFFLSDWHLPKPCKKDTFIKFDKIEPFICEDTSLRTASIKAALSMGFPGEVYDSGLNDIYCYGHYYSGFINPRVTANKTDIYGCPIVTYKWDSALETLHFDGDRYRGNCYYGGLVDDYLCKCTRPLNYDRTISITLGGRVNNYTQTIEWILNVTDANLTKKYGNFGTYFRFGNRDDNCESGWSLTINRDKTFINWFNDSFGHGVCKVTAYIRSPNLYIDGIVYGRIRLYDNNLICKTSHEAIATPNVPYYSRAVSYAIDWYFGIDQMCGDLMCEPGETNLNCPSDCKSTLKLTLNQAKGDLSIPTPLILNVSIKNMSTKNMTEVKLILTKISDTKISSETKKAIISLYPIIENKIPANENKKIYLLGNPTTSKIYITSDITNKTIEINNDHIDINEDLFVLNLEKNAIYNVTINAIDYGDEKTQNLSFTFDTINGENYLETCGNKICNFSYGETSNNCIIDCPIPTTNNSFVLTDKQENLITTLFIDVQNSSYANEFNVNYKLYVPLKESNETCKWDLTNNCTIYTDYNGVCHNQTDCKCWTGTCQELKYYCREYEKEIVCGYRQYLTTKSNITKYGWFNSKNSYWEEKSYRSKNLQPVDECPTVIKFNKTLSGTGSVVEKDYVRRTNGTNNTYGSIEKTDYDIYCCTWELRETDRCVKWSEPKLVNVPCKVCNSTVCSAINETALRWYNYYFSLNNTLGNENINEVYKDRVCLPKEKNYTGIFSYAEDIILKNDTNLSLSVIDHIYGKYASKSVLLEILNYVKSIGFYPVSGKATEEVSDHKGTIIATTLITGGIIAAGFSVAHYRIAKKYDNAYEQSLKKIENSINKITTIFNHTEIAYKPKGIYVIDHHDHEPTYNEIMHRQKFNVKIDKPSLKEIVNWYIKTGLSLKEIINTMQLAYPQFSKENIVHEYNIITGKNVPYIIVFDETKSEDKFDTSIDLTPIYEPKNLNERITSATEKINTFKELVNNICHNPKFDELDILFVTLFATETKNEIDQISKELNAKYSSVNVYNLALSLADYLNKGKKSVPNFLKYLLEVLPATKGPTDKIESITSEIPLVKMFVDKSNFSESLENLFKTCAKYGLIPKDEYDNIKKYRELLQDYTETYKQFWYAQDSSLAFLDKLDDLTIIYGFIPIFGDFLDIIDSIAHIVHGEITKDNEEVTINSIAATLSLFLSAGTIKKLIANKTVLKNVLIKIGHLSPEQADKLINKIIKYTNKADNLYDITKERLISLGKFSAKFVIDISKLTKNTIKRLTKIPRDAIESFLKTLKKMSNEIDIIEFLNRANDKELELISKLENQDPGLLAFLAKNDYFNKIIKDASGDINKSADRTIRINKVWSKFSESTKKLYDEVHKSLDLDSFIALADKNINEIDDVLKSIKKLTNSIYLKNIKVRLDLSSELDPDKFKVVKDSLAFAAENVDKFFKNINKANDGVTEIVFTDAKRDKSLVDSYGIRLFYSKKVLMNVPAIQKLAQKTPEVSGFILMHEIAHSISVNYHELIVAALGLSNKAPEEYSKYEWLLINQAHDLAVWEYLKKALPDKVDELKKGYMEVLNERDAIKNIKEFKSAKPDIDKLRKIFDDERSVPFLAEWLIVDKDAKEIIEKISDNINDNIIKGKLKEVNDLHKTYLKIIDMVK